MTGPERRDGRVVFVTGAAGFIGSMLCRRLSSAGYSVTGYDNLSRGRRELLPPAVHLVEGDIRDGRRVDEAIATAKPDCVIHLAAMHFIPECIARPAETLEVNVEGTALVLDSCGRHPVRNVVFASSAAVYAPSDTPCREGATPLVPLEVYGESKLAAERLVGSFYAQAGIPSTILRLFNAIGRNETNPHVIPHIFESLQTSDAISLGNIAPCRDYIDTRDIAEAISAVVQRPNGLRTFNVGTGVAYSVRDVIDVLQRILGRSITVVEDPARMRSTERMLLAADIQAISSAVKWTPRLTLEDTLRDLVSAYGLQTQAPSTT